MIPEAANQLVEQARYVPLCTPKCLGLDLEAKETVGDDRLKEVVLGTKVMANGAGAHAYRPATSPRVARS